ncbi:MAG: hypothetical protein RIF36_01585 [Imperialibacter sp.]|uniref:DUF6600 domain-containing protein n=1 Tax=Imperialibacter sp. TaxID=2038411 RepID=UPI0032EA90A0
MKTLHKHTIAGILLIAFTLFLPLSDTKAQGPISFDVFYHELAPYGSWVQNPGFGQVWVPNAQSGFHPYVTRGHWIMTDYGNTWVSDYSWGWAPFHYGRWYLDDYYGWAWVPGYEWGPAWVAWRSGGGHYGWAPLSPGLNVNVSINIGRRIPRGYWTFVPQRYITSHRIYDYCLPSRRVTRVYNHTTVINNTYVYNNQHHYYSGPQVREIERVTRQRVTVRQVRPARRPGSPALRNGSVTMYQPTSRGTRGASTRVTTAPRSSTPESYRGSADQRSTYGRTSRSSSAVQSTTPRTRSPRTDYQATPPTSTSRSRSAQDAGIGNKQNTSSNQRSAASRGNYGTTTRPERSSVNKSSNSRTSRQYDSGANQRSSVSRSGNKQPSAVPSTRSSGSRSSKSPSSTSRSSVSRSGNSRSQSAVSSSGSSQTKSSQSSTTRSRRNPPN